MAVNESIRAELPEDALVFDNSSFDNSIVGVSEDDRVIYDYDLMIAEFRKDEGCSLREAMDWVDYNTIRRFYPRISRRFGLVEY